MKVFLLFCAVSFLSLTGYADDREFSEKPTKVFLHYAPLRPVAAVSDPIPDYPHRTRTLRPLKMALSVPMASSNPNKRSMNNIGRHRANLPPKLHPLKNPRLPEVKYPIYPLYSADPSLPQLMIIQSLTRRRPPSRQSSNPFHLDPLPTQLNKATTK